MVVEAKKKKKKKGEGRGVHRHTHFFLLGNKIQPITTLLCTKNPQITPVRASILEKIDTAAK